MGCSSSTSNLELPEKLNWTRPDFDELCSKGENSLKLLNEMKNGVLAHWDLIIAKLNSSTIKPDMVYLIILLGLSQESQGDYLSIDLHLAQTLPGYSKIRINNHQLSEVCMLWESFCNELLCAVPKIHSVHEDIIQTAEIYYQVIQDSAKNKANNVDKSVEEGVKQNLKILAAGADFFHTILILVIDWVERLNNLFASIDQNKINQIHLAAKNYEGIGILAIVEKEQENLRKAFL